MVKHEIKVEFGNSDTLKQIIEKTYFEDGYMGKISNNSENYIVIDESDDVNYTIFKGLNSVTAKLSNDEVIDGSMRFMVDETHEDLRLYPISIYCIKDDSRYIFY